LVAGIAALLFWFGAIYVASTKVIPEAGGDYIEGVAAQPRYINPIISQTSSADADIVELVYSGLFSCSPTGPVEKRLASDYSVSEDGRIYTVNMVQGAKWHDGEEVTAEDVLFTVRAIQNPAYKSPLRPNWLSVEVSSTDRYTVVFELKKPYAGFLQNLTVGILPKHIWETIAPENFFLADYNLAPVGSGPYRFYDSEKDSSGNMLSYELRAFDQYFAGAPYISSFTFHFYPDEESLVDAYIRKEVMGVSMVSPAALARLEERKSTRVYETAVPRLFSVFLNPVKSVPLANREVREALSLATDRQAIIDAVLSGKGRAASSPILPFMTGYAEGVGQPGFDSARAEALLDEKGWKKGDDGIRAKDGVRIEFQLTVPDWPDLVKTADMLKSQWERIGVQVTVAPQSVADLQQNSIRPREYQALLFGQASLIDSDPYSFWHSSQKQDGLNLAMFDDKDADDILVALREEVDPSKRLEKYRAFQEIVAREHPAVFLYSPAYLYVMSSAVKGVDLRAIDGPDCRLGSVKDWYIETERIRK
jgi:peptide/nickel transport system substrate-binding protein